MAWTGLVARTERHGDSLGIVVHYTDDNENEFDQTITANSPQTDSWLQDQITSKLNQLNSLDDYEASVNDNMPADTAIFIDSNSEAVVSPPVSLVGKLGTS